MEENIFKTGSKKRAKDQDAIKAANNISEQIEKSAQKIRVNFSLSSESNEKMGEKAKKMGISKSALLQLWIHEHCD